MKNGRIVRRISLFAVLVLAVALAAIPRIVHAGDDMPGMSDMNKGLSHHMSMTVLRPEGPGDRARADAIVAGARAAMKSWPDVPSAEAAGFVKFAPGVALPIEHYSNERFYTESLYGKLNPAHPTSMIFERHGQALTLVGVMYTAGKGLEESDLNGMVPLSIAQWHKHVDLCAPAGGTLIDPAGKFGFFGTIDTKAACDAANGNWIPQAYGWMVHVWPNERDQKGIWAVERLDDHGHGSMSI